jgi:hypothetical protein
VREWGKKENYDAKRANALASSWHYRDGLNRFPELLPSRHFSKMRLAPPKLRGDGVLWFERLGTAIS